MLDTEKQEETEKSEGYPTSFNSAEINRHRLQKQHVGNAVGRAGWPNIGDKISACQTRGRRCQCNGCDYVWTIGDSCKHRLCPHCGKVRAMRLYDVHKKLAERPNLKHLVLTIKNVDNIGGQTKLIRKYFERLRHRSVFKKAWRGGIYAIEYTYNRDTGWHVHIHALVDGDFIPQDYISKIWNQVNGNRGMVVWIERARQSREVLKYMLKPSEDLLNDDDQLNEFILETTASRLVSGWGKWHGVCEKILRAVIECPNCGCREVKVFITYTVELDGSNRGEHYYDDT